MVGAGRQWGSWRGGISLKVNHAPHRGGGEPQGCRGVCVSETNAGDGALAPSGANSSTEK